MDALRERITKPNPLSYAVPQQLTADQLAFVILQPQVAPLLTRQCCSGYSSALCPAAHAGVQQRPLNYLIYYQCLQVERAIQAILASVCRLRPTAPDDAHQADENTEHGAFCRANMDTHPDTYYSPAILTELAHIHDTAHRRVADGLLQAASAAPPSSTGAHQLASLTMGNGWNLNAPGQARGPAARVNTIQGDGENKC
jgi:hypothetical protein